jgi:hypothetical protein
VFRRGDPPEAIYTFKHALVQDAAYENLLKSRRQVLHRRIAETLRDRFQTMAESQPEVVAHHFTQAGLGEAAVEWWVKAVDRALERSANNEAIAHLEKAISLAEGRPMVLPSDSCGCGCRPRTVMHYFMVECTASQRRLLRLRAPASLPRGSKTPPRGSRPITACGWEALFAPTSRRCARWRWRPCATPDTRPDCQRQAGHTARLWRH